MDEKKEILEMVKHFTEVIKEINSSFAALSISLSMLTQQMDKVPQLKQIESLIKIIENKFINYTEKNLSKTVDNLETIKDGIKGLNDFIIGSIGKISSEIENFKLSSKFQISEIELKKQEIDLEKTKVIENSSIKKSKIKIHGEIILAILGGSGLISGIIYLIFKLFTSK